MAQALVKAKVVTETDVEKANLVNKWRQEEQKLIDAKKDKEKKPDEN
jgi:hypothetical protein